MALVTHNGTVAISVRRATRHVPLVKGSAPRSMRYVFMNGTKITVYYFAFADGREEGGSSININLTMGEWLRVL